MIELNQAYVDKQPQCFEMFELSDGRPTVLFACDRIKDHGGSHMQTGTINGYHWQVRWQERQDEEMEHVR